MSNWASDATNDDHIMNADMKWKVKVKSIEENLRKLKYETDNMSEKFGWVKTNNGTYEGFQNWIHKMTDSCDEITKNMNDLVNMIPKTHDGEYATKNIQMKQLSKRVENQIKHIQNLSSDIQKEMEKLYLAKKMAASIISENNATGDSRLSSDSAQGYQMSTLEDPQLAQVLEDQRQCEKLLKDVIQLESLVVKISEMVHEQGEAVIRIETNVVEALDKTEEGVQQLRQAEEHKKALDKKKMCIIIIVIIIVVVIAIIIGICAKYG